ncbi:MAG: hypothetical protein EOP11_03255 [Proteobacteria bacterium]|nr:MAG: hypothetical protein EOP11_03255 [Pseudomonadota bacterium]
MNASFVIAKASARGLVRDRIFHASLVLNLMLLLFSVFLSTLTIVDQRKILLDFGFAAISFVGIVFSIFLGGALIRRELDSRVAYTILAKPVSRAEYVIGKLLGGMGVIAALNVFCFLTLALALWLQGEILPDGFWAVFYLTCLEGLLYLAISVLISLLTSSLFLSATLAFAVFLVARSAYAFELMAAKTQGLLYYLWKTLYIAFPAGQRFDVRDVTAYGRPYPAGMLPESTLYFLAYLMVMITLAILSFRRKDLP